MILFSSIRISLDTQLIDIRCLLSLIKDAPLLSHLDDEFPLCSCSDFKLFEKFEQFVLYVNQQLILLIAIDFGGSFIQDSTSKPIISFKPINSILNLERQSQPPVYSTSDSAAIGVSLSSNAL